MYLKQVGVAVANIMLLMGRTTEISFLALERVHDSTGGS